MNLRTKYFILAVAVLSYSGCCSGNGPGLFGGPGLFSNVNGARVAAPTSIAAANQNQSRVAFDPYYGQQPAAITASAANATGWRPLGTNAATGAQTNPATYRPSNSNIQNAPQNTSGNNLTVASSSTSTLQPGNRVASVTPQAQRQPILQIQQPSIGQVPVNTIRPNNGSQFASNSVTTGMRLNDATQLNNFQPRPSNTGIFNRASEYVARPNTMVSNQYIAQPTVVPRYNGPNFVNGQIASTSPNQFNRPAGNSFTNPYGYSNNYQNGYPNQNQNYPAANVAQEWRQRNAR